MFELPYLKIEVLDRKGLAHRQTASVWLKKLVSAGILSEQKKGKTLYFINYRLSDFDKLINPFTRRIPVGIYFNNILSVPVDIYA